MRIRLTRNQDKERGFVNGAMGIVEVILCRSPLVFVMKTQQNFRILVHHTWDGNLRFHPITYAYASTMRRSQRATLDAVALRFDRKLPDRGYSYVGASRMKKLSALWHIGQLRRTDWLPV